MSGFGLTKLAAGAAVVGIMTVGLTLPAQATDVAPGVPGSDSPGAMEPLLPATPKPAPEVAPRRAVREDVDITIEQLNKGITLQKGMHGPAVTEVQTRLNKLGILGPTNGVYNDTTARNVARFNEKFRGYEYMENKILTATAWKKLRSVSNGRTVPKWCEAKRPAAICVDKTQRIVRYFKKGKLVMTLDARFGVPGNRTRTGHFKIFRKVWNDYSSEYHTPMPYSMYFSGGQAIHYSLFFPTDGYNGGSHGCVNTRDKAGIKRLWRMVKIGTPTFVYGHDH